MGKSSGLDALQKATMATTTNGNWAQTALKDNNLEILGKLLKEIRLILMGEMVEDDLSSMEDVNEAVKAFNALKRTWKETSYKTSPIE